MDNTETGTAKNVVYMIELGKYTVLTICYVLRLFVATSKTSESVGEGENNESSEEKTASKPVVKEEADLSEVKVETPELKVAVPACNRCLLRLFLMANTHSFRLDNWLTP